jgi:hypothetical protein
MSPGISEHLPSTTLVVVSRETMTAKGDLRQDLFEPSAPQDECESSPHFQKPHSLRGPPGHAATGTTAGP